MAHKEWLANACDKERKGYWIHMCLSSYHHQDVATCWTTDIPKNQLVQRVLHRQKTELPTIFKSFLILVGLNIGYTCGWYSLSVEI